jgi:hypothetical protein
MGRDCFEEQGVNRKIIFKLNLRKIICEYVDKIKVA